MQDENFTKRIFSATLASTIAGRFKQSQLAEAASLTQSAVSQYLAGARLPGSLELFRLSSALGVTMEFLLTGQATAGGPVKIPDAEAIRRDERARIAARLRKVADELEG